MKISGLGKMLAAVTVLTGALLVSSASAGSKARIVRLSDVQGSVQMDRGTGDGFDKTFLNMPVVEGSRLKTGDDGRAEVEFEDGSALRVVPNSEVEFTRLALGNDGQKLSTMQLVAGMAYVNYRGKSADQFTLNFGRESVTLTEGAHFRIGLRNNEATLAVIKGRLNVNGQSGPIEVDQKHTATFDVDSDRYDVAKNYEAVSYDAWDKQQSEYHDRYASNGSSRNGSPYAYGMSDLNYYGNYMWVSSYPWGWMPYRYGNWAFVPGFGWVWQPGYWNTWYAVPRVVNPPRRVSVPVPPVRGIGTVMVGRGLSVNPPSGLPTRVTLAPGSAGLGVPRGTVRDLGRISRDVNRNMRPVEVAAEPRGRIAPPSRPMGGNLGGSPGSTSSGSRPPSSTSQPSRVYSPPTASPRMPSAPPMRSSKPH